MGELLRVQVPSQEDNDERSEAQLHEYDRVWKEEWNINCEPMNKNWIRGIAKQDGSRIQ